MESSTVPNALVALVAWIVLTTRCNGKIGDVEQGVIVAYSGTSVNFKCEGGDNTKWLNEDKEEMNTRIEGSFVVYTIPRVSERDIGTYYCSISDFVNDVLEEWLNPVSLYVAEREVGKVKISPKIAYLGQRVQFSCDYDNNIAWFIERTPQLPESPPISGEKRFSIPVEEYDSGFYLCYGMKDDGKYYISKEHLDVINYRVPRRRQYGSNYFDRNRDVWCSICMANADNSDMIRRLKNCDHEFHDACIQQWLDQRGQDTCPVCRERVANEDTEQ